MYTRHLIALVFLLLTQAFPALAASRVALLIGNAAYDDAPLVNPPNDVKVVAQSLKTLGFEVKSVINANRKVLQQTIREFGERARQAEVALFYFSGHGLQSRGENYLVPIGARIQYENDIADEAVSANSVMYRLETAHPKIAVVVMDACRDNPLAGRTKSMNKGLVRIDALPSSTLVAYATTPGATAGDEGHYARALAKYLKQPGLDLKEVFDRVGAEVDQLTGGRQRPRKDDGLYTKVYLAGGGGGGVDPLTIELATWQAAQQTHTIASYQAYLETYPQGRFSKQARAAVEKLKGDGGGRSVSTFRDCPECPEMIYTHLVESSQNIAVSMHEITLKNWNACVEAQRCPSRRGADGNNGSGLMPIANIDYRDAMIYLDWLSAKTRHTYRLLTTKEWIKLAYGGHHDKKWSWGNDDSQACTHENFADQAAKDLPGFHPAFYIVPCNDGYAGPAPVGKFKANAAGLKDMLGNVAEMTLRCEAAEQCTAIGIMGGTWFHDPELVNSAVRDVPSPYIGLRIARIERR